MIKYDAELEQALLDAANTRLKVDCPVWEIDMEWYGLDNPLPTIWYTERVADEDDEVIGRTYMGYYPMDDEKDLEGWHALNLGARYYWEGMEYSAPKDHEMRVECFKASEILFRHAETRSNPIAALYLGYVYSCDLCEGDYFIDHRKSETEEDYSRVYPHEKRAFECFLKAAQANLAEGWYKLGDMYEQGIGCKRNPLKALSCRRKAFDLGQDE